MKKYKMPAPKRAGTAKRDRLAELLRALKSHDPDGYRALMCLARTTVEKIST